MPPLGASLRDFASRVRSLGRRSSAPAVVPVAAALEEEPQAAPMPPRFPESPAALESHIWSAVPIVPASAADSASPVAAPNGAPVTRGPSGHAASSSAAIGPESRPVSVCIPRTPSALSLGTNLGIGPAPPAPAALESAFAPEEARPGPARSRSPVPAIVPPHGPVPELDTAPVNRHNGDNSHGDHNGHNQHDEHNGPRNALNALNVPPAAPPLLAGDIRSEPAAHEPAPAYPGPPINGNADEAFPRLAISPFQANAMQPPALGTVWQLPGTDRFPNTGARQLNASWLQSHFEQLIVGGHAFLVPIALLTQYQSWRMMFSVQRPLQGWVINNVHHELFALLLECLISASGFEGTEQSLNLVILVATMGVALNWGMQPEVEKLAATIRRYIARRLLFRNPFRPDFARVLDHNYYVYRSEELYRTWQLLQGNPMLQSFLNIGEIATLYGQVIPHDLWPALTPNFDDVFSNLLDLTMELREVPPAVEFRDWWLRFFRRTGYLDLAWINDEPDIVNHFFRQANLIINRDDAAGEGNQRLGPAAEGPQPPPTPPPPPPPAALEHAAAGEAAAAVGESASEGNTLVNVRLSEDAEKANAEAEES